MKRIGNKYLKILKIISNFCISDGNWFFVKVPGRHSMSASPIYPGKHKQDIVLNGNVSTTEHSAFIPHGFVSIHGFLHNPEKHASLLGQSESILHCGCFSCGAKIYYVINNTMVRENCTRT